ncbi:hypothetical protein NDU88_003561 [Pleurodeles waltl]|uniref:Uncharacterized protein n=1 Tax=Pleurodeles waltl TaxID=8319 RepID=A0AAV7T5I8_PLEWA|nr:hypothetical protein NDU88_003561 [Pleurodeles waltl]
MNQSSCDPESQTTGFHHILQLAQQRNSNPDTHLSFLCAPPLRFLTELNLLPGTCKKGQIIIHSKDNLALVSLLKPIFTHPPGLHDNPSWRSYMPFALKIPAPGATT